MSFEVVYKDILGRIGRLKTKHGIIETPALFPVINPLKSEVSAEKVLEVGFNSVITNAYIIKKRYGDQAKLLGVHKILGVECPVMTDSGAYQILVYGYAEVDPDEILIFQKEIGSDIGVILDIPSRADESIEETASRVYETLRRAKRALEFKEELNGMLLVAPIQGAPYKRLVKFSATKLGKLDFDIYAVGSPTQYLEEYRFKEVIEIALTARLNIPFSKPLHLFGAGHPLILPLAVAMGCDLFDSASYILYARDERYISAHGTLRLSQMEYFPCSCPVCSQYTPSELREMDYHERIRLLALHNLYEIRREISMIKEAIKEGFLWELIESKCKAHPSLWEAFKIVRKYAEIIEKYSVSTRASAQGIFLLSQLSVFRPEIIRHSWRLVSNYAPTVRAKYLIFLPDIGEKPFTESRFYSSLLKKLREKLRIDKLPEINVCVYNEFFGIVPVEVSESYPLSQHERINIRSDNIVAKKMREILIKYLSRVAENTASKLKVIVFCCDKFFYRIFKEVAFLVKKRYSTVKFALIVGSIDEYESALDYIIKLIDQ